MSFNRERRGPGCLTVLAASADVGLVFDGIDVIGKSITAPDVLIPDFLTGAAITLVAFGLSSVLSSARRR